MATIMLIFLVALGIAAMLGWTADTRDSADWRTDPPPEADKSALDRASCAG
jgi:hypothetical protein